MPFSRPSPKADRWIVAASFGSVAVLIASGVLAHWSTVDVVSALQRRGEVRTGLLKLEKVESILKDAETGQRGYLLTGKKDYLAPFVNAEREVPREFGELKGLFVARPEIYSRISEAEGLAVRKMEELRATIRVRDRSGLEAARRLVLDDSGHQLMLRIRFILDGLEEDESRLLMERDIDARLIIIRSRWIVTGGSLLALLLTALAGALLLQSNRKKREAQTSLRESRQFLDSIIENVPTALIVKRASDSGFLRVNRAGETLLGGPEATLLGKTPYDCFPESEAAQVVSSDRQVADSGKLVEIPIQRVTTALLGPRVLHTKKIPVFDDRGRPLYIVGISEDVTEQVRVREELVRTREAALEASRMKSEFLANMSHEIRTPMNGVIGMTGLVLDTPLSPQQREYVETIRSCGESLLELINDILDFSKVEAGKLKMENAPFDLNQVVESTTEMLALRAQSRGTELAVFVSPDVPSRLSGDAGRLKQVLLNLVGNAVKFTENGSVAVRVTAEGGGADQVRLRFEIEDTGIGIASEAQGKLFQAFSQADGSTSRKFGGTGLGLAISRQLVALMGGEIGVRSEPGHGSLFWFTAGFERAPHAAGERLPASPKALSGVRVLIVDDNEINRLILSHQLGAWGMLVDRAPSAREAMELLANGGRAETDPYRLAVIDMRMPGMSGLELARTIRSDASLGCLKVVLMSSLGQVTDPKELREAGVDLSLTKPVKQTQLREALVALLGAAPSSRPVEAALASRPAPGSERIRVLVAEDNAVNQKIALMQLAKLGYEADAVNNGREALDALERIPYDIVLMDCQMPEMDGFEATRQLRSRGGAGGGQPRVIAMTANALQGDREKCLDAGMDDYISKPVRSEELASVIERCLEARPV